MKYKLEFSYDDEDQYEDKDELRSLLNNRELKSECLDFSEFLKREEEDVFHENDEVEKKISEIRTRFINTIGEYLY